MYCSHHAPPSFSFAVADTGMLVMRLDTTTPPSDEPGIFPAIEAPHSVSTHPSPQKSAEALPQLDLACETAAASAAQAHMSSMGSRTPYRAMRYQQQVIAQHRGMTAHPSPFWYVLGFMLCHLHIYLSSPFFVCTFLFIYPISFPNFCLQRLTLRRRCRSLLPHPTRAREPQHPMVLGSSVTIYWSTFFALCLASIFSRWPR